MPSAHRDGMYTIGKIIKTMMVHVEFDSFDELEPEISWIKGGPGMPAGGRVTRQSGGPLSPGGECFAPKGYLAVEAGNSLELLCASQPGHVANRFAHYIYAQKIVANQAAQ